jgi:hypothetical protein
MHSRRAVLLFPFAFALAQARPDFSGTWSLNIPKSKFSGPLPGATVLKIVHRDPAFQLSRTEQLKKRTLAWAISLTTDGKEVVMKEDDRELRYRLNWKARTLVMDQQSMLAGVKGVSQLVHSLSPDGRVLTVQEHTVAAKKTFDNVWIFDRRP